MFNTMNANSMVVTNLRLPYADWLQVKTVAAEEGLSINEYINRAITFVTKAQSLVANLFVDTSRGNDPIWDLPKLAKMKNKPMGDLSEEDKIIYGG